MIFCPFSAVAPVGSSPVVSLTYWHPDQDTCTADCTAEWQTSEDSLTQAWQRFSQAPAPLGYDPSNVTTAQVMLTGDRYTPEARAAFREVADRVLFFDQGALVEEATPADFFTNPKHDRTKLFLSQIL